MLMVFDSYRSFAPLRMTTKRKRVILSAAKNLYESPVNDIIIEKNKALHSRRGGDAPPAGYNEANRHKAGAPTASAWQSQPACSLFLTNA